MEVLMEGYLLDVEQVKTIIRETEGVSSLTKGKVLSFLEERGVLKDPTVESFNLGSIVGEYIRIHGVSEEVVRIFQNLKDLGKLPIIN